MQKFMIIAAVAALLAGGGYFVLNHQNSEKKTTPATADDRRAHHESSCPTGTHDAGYTLLGKPVCAISNIITNDLTLGADRFWRIQGEVQIGGDNILSAVLSIEPGTVLFGKSGGDFLVINRGSKLLARGTASEPIIFTCENDLKNDNPISGEWGGLVIAGNAPINGGNIDAPFEFSHRQIRFGGTNAHDNSGVLQYVVIKYAGDEVLPQMELNGLSLGGVGDGTLIDFVEVYQGKDDGIELWGGTVNMKHILLLGNRDDSFDTDMGYRGNIQYLYAKKFRVEAGQYGNGIEADNLAESMKSTPISHPVLANFEFVGSAGSKYGILIRRGSGYTLINGFVTGFDRAQLAIHDNVTRHNGEIIFRSVALDGSETNNDLYHGLNGVTGVDINQLFKTGPECRINSTHTTASNVAEVTGNPFFDPAVFVGAYSRTHDWRQGWSYGLE